MIIFTESCAQIYTNSGDNLSENYETVSDIVGMAFFHVRLHLLYFLNCFEDHAFAQLIHMSICSDVELEWHFTDHVMIAEFIIVSNYKSGKTN